MQAVTLEVILRAVFGMDEDDGLADMRQHIQRLLEMTASPLAFLFVAMPGLLRGPAAGAFDRVLQAADVRIFDQIARRRSDPALAERDDILSLLIQACDDHGRRMSDEQLRDERLTAASTRPEAIRRRSIVFAPARGARAILHERVPVPV